MRNYIVHLEQELIKLHQVSMSFLKASRIEGAFHAVGKKKKNKPHHKKTFLKMFQCFSGSRIPLCCLPPQVLQPVPKQRQNLHDQQCPNLCLSARSVHLHLSKWPSIIHKHTPFLNTVITLPGEAQTSRLKRRAHTTKCLNISKLSLCPLESLVPELWVGCHAYKIIDSKS